MLGNVSWTLVSVGSVVLSKLLMLKVNEFTAVDDKTLDHVDMNE